MAEEAAEVLRMPPIAGARAEAVLDELGGARDEDGAGAEGIIPPLVTYQLGLGVETTHDRISASYPSPREFVSQNFFSHCKNSRLSCILHLLLSA
jgi:hypothetical protein